jgi:hypothetical protein
MEPVGLTVGLLGMLGITTVYFWIVRRAQYEAVEQE